MVTLNLSFAELEYVTSEWSWRWPSEGLAVPLICVSIKQMDHECELYKPVCKLVRGICCIYLVDPQGVLLHAHHTLYGNRIRDNVFFICAASPN